jgi:DNA mismatch endonuclease, patch repair protein
MEDRLSRAERSRHMARIRGKNTDPELHLRRALHRMGMRFRLHRSDLPGRPDLVLAKYRAAIFVHGCFWHRHQGCALAYDPKTRTAFWNRKFSENVDRDQRQMRSLLAGGWRIGIVWECSLRSVDKRAAAVSAAVNWLRSDRARAEIPPPPRPLRSRTAGVEEGSPRRRTVRGAEPRNGARLETTLPHPR